MDKNLKSLLQWIKRYWLWRLLAIFSAVILALYLNYIRVTVGLLNWSGFEEKTLWDVLELAIIPVVLLVGGYFFSRAERVTQNQIVDDGQQEAALQAYLDRITKLILENNLIDSEPADKVGNIARMWTLTTLRRLDGKRKGVLMQFLVEAKLIERGERIPDNPTKGLGNRKAVIHMEKADLRNADLNGVMMFSVDLMGANLEGAKLSEVSLSQAVLFDVNLRKADLRNANLRGADLRGVDFTEADLRGADLSSSDQDNRTQFARAKLRVRLKISGHEPNV